MNSRVHEMSDRMNQRTNECTSDGLNEWNYELKERSETNEWSALKRIDWIEPLHDEWGRQVGPGRWPFHGYAADPLCAGCVQVFLNLTVGST